MNELDHRSTVPGDTRIEPRETTKGGDQFLAGSVAVVVLVALLIGSGLGVLLALVYEIFDPVGVETPIAVAWGAIVGAVTCAMVAARQVVGRFTQK